MIYIDKKGKMGWSHLIADSIHELHEFANKIGLKSDWFQEKREKPHYDVKGMMRKRAIENGARIVSSKEIIRVLKENYQ
jgi:hypothetical protein